MFAVCWAAAWVARGICGEAGLAKARTSPMQSHAEIGLSLFLSIWLAHPQSGTSPTCLTPLNPDVLRVCYFPLLRGTQAQTELLYSCLGLENTHMLVGTSTFLKFPASRNIA